MGIFSKNIKPFIIGVCGRSCSGKSTVVKELEEKIQRIIQIYKENPISKIAEISKEVGVSETVVLRVRKENNLEHLGFMHLIGNNNRKYKDELLCKTSKKASTS